MDHAMADLQKADELCPHDATVKVRVCERRSNEATKRKSL